MDRKYLLGRERQSISQSLTSPSMSARAVHRAFAAAYGNLLSIGIFPSRAARSFPLPIQANGTNDEAQAHPMTAAVGAPRPEPGLLLVLAADRVTSGDVPLHIRVALPSDEGPVVALFAAVSDEDLRFRFGGTIKVVDAKIVAPLLQMDRKIGITFLASAADGTLVAASTLADIGESDDAEVALSVHAGWKSRGIAWTLLDHTLAYATAHGLKQVTSFESGDDRLAINLEREMGFVARLVSANPVELSLTKYVAAE